MDNKQKAENLHKITVATFETDIGKKLLEHMQKVYIDRPTYKTGMSIEECAFREGQADVVRKIMQEISRG